MKRASALNLKNRLLVFSMLLAVLLATTGTALAGQWLFDPPIPGTPYHLWLPEGAAYSIRTEVKNNGMVKYVTWVRFDCEEGEYEAGINESETEPGNWIQHDEKRCGESIEFEGRYKP